MSPAPADVVNALELAGRSASIERELTLAQMPRLIEAGALEGTRARAQLTFGMFEGRPMVTAQVAGNVVLTCQRCLRPCEVRVSESAPLIVMMSDEDPAPVGYDVLLANPERLSVVEVIEEQILLGLPLVALHEPGPGCGADADSAPAEPASEDKQRPFANLRELLGKDER